MKGGMSKRKIEASLTWSFLSAKVSSIKHLSFLTKIGWDLLGKGLCRNKL